jgi:hypothetical protein
VYSRHPQAVAVKFETVLEAEAFPEGAYTPQAIHGHRASLGTMTWLVSWKGFHPNDNTWEPTGNLPLWLLEAYKVKLGPEELTALEEEEERVGGQRPTQTVTETNVYTGVVIGLADAESGALVKVRADWGNVVWELPSDTLCRALDQPRVDLTREDVRHFCVCMLCHRCQPVTGDERVGEQVGTPMAPEGVVPSTWGGKPYHGDLDSWMPTEEIFRKDCFRHVLHFIYGMDPPTLMWHRAPSLTQGGGRAARPGDQRRHHARG